MEKRSDAQIYELAYKKVPYGFWDNGLYTPLQCGSAPNKEDVCQLKDNTGDNISDKNYFYSETTGTYWIWKNAPHTDYVGQCQYRRRLYFNEDFDFNNILDKYKIIINRPILLNLKLKTQMMLCHPQIDVKSFESIVYEKSPEYASTFNEIFNNGHILLFSSSYVMTWDLFDNYCHFMFPIIDEYFNRFGYINKDKLKRYVSNRMTSVMKVKPVEYHMLIGGFLQERLFTTWVLKNFQQEQIYYQDFVFMEEAAGLKAINRKSAIRMAERADRITEKIISRS